MIRFWDVETGDEIDLHRTPDWVESNSPANTVVAPNGKAVRVDAETNQIILRDAETEDELVTLKAVGENDWAVFDSDGRWDASPNAQKVMYYTVPNSSEYEIIDFSQLKERYYEPDLLQKLLGYKKEPIKDVAQFKDILLPPAVAPIKSKDAKSTVRQVRLKNRNGGIGRIQVFVNGREFIEDARDKNLKANPYLKEYILSFDLSDAPIIPGQKPDIKVVAWNYDPKAKEEYKGYISSRGTEIIYLGKENENIEPPTLYAIIGGVSDYKGNAIDLRFAAKDAEAIYRAIEVGGKNLFGVDRMKLKLLSTGKNLRAAEPLKENFRQAFEEFAREAKPNDILFVYLSGHGITLGFQTDIYYYLTEEASTTDKQILSKDRRLLLSSTISSEELTQWHKSIKALKQVLILDTCAAGAIGGEFNILKKRTLSTDAKRALERMKDRVGFHVLMGSAADAVSYEASQYGQGLLTYSLLQGIKGAALQTDGQIDISKLFNYAADTVPNLAKNVGGIQRPEIRIPAGGASFAIGLIKTDDEKKAIPLANVKPIMLRTILQNKTLGYDDLKLTTLLRDKLIEKSYVSSESSTAAIVFVDTDEMPDAIIPSGNYEVGEKTVKVNINLIRDNRVLERLTIEGDKNNLPDFILRMAKEISERAAILALL